MLAPVPMIGAVLALLLVVNISAVQVLSQAPHPDLQFSLTDQGVIASDGERSWVAVRLLNDQEAIELQPGDFIEEPDVVSTRSTYRRFFERQALIVRILQSENPRLETESGEVIPVTLHEEPLPASPGFWVQLFVGNIGLLVGAAVLAFQRSNMGARHLFVTGLGLSISASAAAIYSSRPIAIDGETFQLLSNLNFLGVLVFCCGFLCLMWNYPKPVFNRRIAPGWYLLMLAVFLVDAFALIESMDLTRRIPPVATLIMAAAMLVVQWRHSEGDPLTRQSLRWFVFVTLSGSTFFTLFILVPPLFRLELVVSQAAAFLAFLTIYVGLAVGVARYPLFDLQQYWMKSLIWLAGALLVIAVNLAIVSVLGLSGSTAIWMLLASLLVVAIPLKIAGTQYFLNRASRNFHHHLPRIVERMARSDIQDLGALWERQIQDIFRPLDMKREAVTVVKPVVAKRGLGLVVPMIDSPDSLHLEYADEGTRLFNSLDVTLIETLISLFDISRSRQHLADEARLEERGRLRRDIHDTLGGRLLTIMHSASDERVESESRQAMGELRDILSAVDGDSILFSGLLDQWEQQLGLQVQASHAALDWQVEDRLQHQDWQVAGKDRLNLGRILREAVTNALRHAEAAVVRINFDWNESELVIVISNNGLIGDPDQWQPGYGLKSIRERAEELQAQVEWQVEQGWLHLVLTIPTTHWARESNAAA